ncbi:MAG: T9SS type A sorting domain-containing protein [Flavobacterium sp.]
MKKITLLFLFTILTLNQLNAQFVVNKINGTPFTNNEVIEFTTHSSSVAELKFTVHNNAAQNLDFRIRCTNLVNTDGSNFQLCWGGECIPNVAANGTYPNYQNVINAGANTVGFNDSFKNFNPGDGANYPMDFSFRFFTRDLNGNTVGSSFNITYRYMGPNMSVEQKDKLSAMGVKVLNNVANQFIGLEITKPVQYEIINLQGQIITIENIAENTNIDVSSYQTGLYFMNFKSNEGISDTVKIFKK